MSFTYRKILVGLLVGTLFHSAAMAADTIKIGFNIAQSGMHSLVGKHTRNVAELFLKDINASGGLEVGGKKYPLEFLYGDNESQPSAASSLAIKQISKERVHAIIGPHFSSLAIPVSRVANSFSTPMISPWSTSPRTTQDKPFVFRTCFVDTIQGTVLTSFVKRQFNATKSAVLFDVLNAYPRTMAQSFKNAFEATNGEGSVVAFEEFRTGDRDFTKQLTRIKNSKAEVLFVPQHYKEVPVIVKQAKKIGISIPIIGSDTWASSKLTELCGNPCNGLFFSCNYAPDATHEANRQFIKTYSAAYNELPDEPAALTWDSLGILLQAIKNTGGLSDNIIEDRKTIAAQISKVKGFKGATGTTSQNATGNPEKCTVIIKIEDGSFIYHDSVCPQ